MRFAIKFEDKEIGHFDLASMPGCPAVGVSYHLELDEQYRNQGHGTRAQQERLDLARTLGFSVLLASVVYENKAQDKILQRAGWKRFTFFDNSITGHRVGLWSKNLTDPYDCGFYEGKGCR